MITDGGDHRNSWEISLDFLGEETSRSQDEILGDSFRVRVRVQVRIRVRVRVREILSIVYDMTVVIPKP